MNKKKKELAIAKATQIDESQIFEYVANIIYY